MLWPLAWTAVRAVWDAAPGRHELRCRATDAAGSSQPDEPAWNLGGDATNAVSASR
jgi:sulfane dehydrogenase subunit SoxC